MKYLSFIFLALPSISGMVMVILSYNGIYIPDYLIFPLGTGSLFYAQGTLLFHVLGIGIIYLPLGVITYLILRLGFISNTAEGVWDIVMDKIAGVDYKIIIKGNTSISDGKFPRPKQ